MQTSLELETKADYKKTKLGFIPSEWSFLKIKDIGKIVSGATPLRERHSDYFLNGTYSWVKTTDLNNGSILKTEEKVTNLALKEARLKLLPVGTVLVAMYGGYNQIGRTGLLTHEATINQALSSISVDRRRVDPYYLLVFLNHYVGRWKKFAASSRKDPNITRKDVEHFEVILPPLQEQRAIAAILSTWDKGIEKLQQLITAKQKRKKALMQQLLTGKKRFQEFTDEWQEYHLKNLCTLSKGEQLNKEFLTKSGLYPSYSGGIAPSGYTDNWNTEANTITISEGGNSCGFVNFIKTNFWCGGHCYALQNLKKKLINKDFLFQILKYNEASIMKLRVGSGLPNVQKKDLQKFVLIIPSINEQAKIALVLNAADKEINTLQQKLKSLKQQKKGLMQKLLTGQVRVNVPQ